MASGVEGTLTLMGEEGKGGGGVPHTSGELLLERHGVQPMSDKLDT